MTKHRLDAAPDTVHWGYFDAKLKPLITIDPGDTVVISTVSGGLGQLPDAGMGFDVPAALPAIHAAVQPKLGGPHILTGPVAVRGAKAGQVLEVRIKAIELHYDWGYNMIRPLAGALPDDFKLYCGHEYTASNIKFALTIEPDNAALKARAEEVRRLREANKPTIPTLLGEEKKANVFLRADEPSVAASVRMKDRSAAEIFGELRERKNKS